MVSGRAGRIRGGGSDPYELNINYMDALDAAAGDLDTERSILEISHRPCDHAVA